MVVGEGYFWEKHFIFPMKSFALVEIFLAAPSIQLPDVVHKLILAMPMTW